MKGLILLCPLLLSMPAAFASETQGTAAPEIATESSETLANDIFRPIFLRTFNFYKPGERLPTFVIATAKDLVSGKEYQQEREIDQYWYEAIRGTELEELYHSSNGVIFLRPGTYRFSGHDNFCFLQNKEVTIDPQTKTVDLLIGCE